MIPLSALLSACQLTPTPESVLGSRIVGTWCSADPAYSMFDCEEKTYFPDGKACGFIMDMYADGRAELVVYRSRWRIANGRLFSTVLASNADVLPAGAPPIVDGIVAIGPRIMRLRSVTPPESGVYERFRLAVARGDSLCRFFDLVYREAKGDAVHADREYDAADP